MNSNEMLLAFVSTSLVLLINWRALAAHRLPAGRMARMALSWLVIIVLMALAARLIFH